MNLFIPFRYRFKQILHSRRSKTDSLLNSLNRNFTLSLPAKIDSMNILLLVGGLLLILLGANGLTDGAASVAQRFPYTQHRYRTDNRRFRNVCPGTDGQRIFRT